VHCDDIIANMAIFHHYADGFVAVEMLVVLEELSSPFIINLDVHRVSVDTDRFSEVILYGITNVDDLVLEVLHPTRYEGVLDLSWLGFGADQRPFAVELEACRSAWTHDIDDEGIAFNRHAPMLSQPEFHLEGVLADFVQVVRLFDDKPSVIGVLHHVKQGCIDVTGRVGKQLLQIHVDGATVNWSVQLYHVSQVEQPIYLTISHIVIHIAKGVVYYSEESRWTWVS
jgi:hypothetical protein